MVKIQFLGHSCFLVSFPEARALIDPFFNFTERPGVKREVPCPCKPRELKNIDLILVSHEHFDHFDKKSIEEIALRDNSVVIGHDSVLQELSLPSSLLRPTRIGEKLKAKKVSIEAVSAHHPGSFYPMGFVLDAGSERIYHAGDTDLIQEFEELKVDVALLPIGGKYTMDVVDAVKATKSLKPRHVIPMHYNTFEFIKADPLEFKQRIEKSILDTIPVILKPGEKKRV